MTRQRPVIRAIATATPPGRMSQHAAQAFAPARDGSTESLHERTGIESRAVALGDKDDQPGPMTSFFPERDAGPIPTTAQRMSAFHEHAAPLAADAARAALLEADTKPEDVTHIVTASCTGLGAPGIDVDLIQRLGLPTTTQRTNIGFMGCHAAINAMRVAGAIAHADANARILLVAVELCSLHFSYEDRNDARVANAIFADGAAAMIIDADAHPTPAVGRLGPTGSTIVPDTTGAMSWHIGDHGFVLRLSRHVPATIQRELGAHVDRFLQQHDLHRDHIGGWAIHPGGPRILDACAAALDLNETQLSPSRNTLRDYGNMSSPTTLFIAKRLHDQQIRKPWVFLGFGPGLVTEMAVVI